MSRVVEDGCTCVEGQQESAKAHRPTTVVVRRLRWVVVVVDKESASP